MKNVVQLIVKNGIGNYYYTVPIAEGMEKSELAKIIGAKEIKEFNILSGHVKKFDNFSENPERLVNENEYLVITNNIENTKALIKDYKGKNEDINRTNLRNQDIDLIKNYEN